jgi:putative membrane protein
MNETVGSSGRTSPARTARFPACTLRLATTLAGPWLVASVFAHEIGPATVPNTTWASWSFEPGVICSLGLSAWLYLRGLRRLRAATRVPRKLAREAIYFAAGWLVLVVALVSPLHPWGSELFAAHMTQHELLMIAAAPLLVLGRPGRIWLWAFSKPAAHEIQLWNRAVGGERIAEWLTQPLAAWTVHALALWIWHIPALFESTLRSPMAHALQHLSFFGTAVIFWQAVFFGRQRRMGYGIAVFYLFATAMESGALGALITFAGHAWYPSYAVTAPAWGFSALEDQQLGGLIMWIPSALVYVAAGLILFARWLEESGTRAASPADPPASARESSMVDFPLA